MKRVWPCLALAFIVLLSGCWGGEEILGEDWPDYAEVFVGPGPDEDLEKLFVKINYLEDGELAGEIEGPLFAEIRGTFQDVVPSRRIFFEATYRSEQCMGITRVLFEGAIEGDELSGILSYSGCAVWEFFYTGTRIGGAGR